MGPWGAIIMTFGGACLFGAACALGAAALGGRPPLLAALLLVPALVLAAVALAARALIRRAPPGAFEPDARAGEVIGRATVFEAVGVPVVALGLANTGHADVVLPGVALVVGLHFVPMAYAVPFRPFYALAGALVAAAGLGAWLPQPAGSVGAGVAGALALWAAAALALRRGARLARGPVAPDSVLAPVR